MKVKSEQRGIKELTPHPLNYNTHPDIHLEELEASLNQFDQFKNVVVWSPAELIDLGDGQKLSPDKIYILGGHGLWAAASRAGRKQIEVKDYTGLPYKEALLLMEVDNASTSGAVIDAVKLATLAQQTRQAAESNPNIAGMLTRAREAAGLTGDPESWGENGDPGSNKSDGSLLALTEITIDDPHHKVEPGEVWRLGDHVLVCADVLTGWDEWAGFLVGEDVLFIPYAGPFVPLSLKAKKHQFVMVQPDKYIAGHIIDRYVDIYGEDTVDRDN